MTKAQLKDGIKLGKQILKGEADLLELNNKSSSLLGKLKGGSDKMPKEDINSTSASAVKRKDDGEDSSRPSKRVRQISDRVLSDKAESPLGPSNAADNSVLLAKIENSKLSPFQKRVLSALLQIPMGQYTTYGILAKYLHSSARAVGAGLRGNPFAPEVPCHRVLATGGGIGGFKGSWGRNGEDGLNDAEKRSLLRKEGLRFDGLGRVVSKPWDGFQ
jgi:methylated-DNA-[protein]-cysteine S-methyltransferase